MVKDVPFTWESNGNDMLELEEDTSYTLSRKVKVAITKKGPAMA